jgi:hypothetical protein
MDIKNGSDVVLKPIFVKKGSKYEEELKPYFVTYFDDSVIEVPLNRGNYKKYAISFPKLKRKMEKVLKIKP